MKSITRRQFANGLMFFTATTLLTACNKTESTEVATGLQTVAGADEPGAAISQTFYSDDEIAEIVKTLKSEYTADGRLRAIDEAHGLMGLAHGYHTDSSTLSVTGPIPVYEYKDGAFAAQYPFYGDDAADSMLFLFDGDELVYLIESAKSEYGEMYRNDWGLEYVAFYFAGEMADGYYSAADAYKLSTTKEAALVYAEDGLYLYDGTNIWLVDSALGGYQGIYDPLNDDPITTSGLDSLDRANLLERQSFDYDSPELVVEVNGKTATADSVADYEATLESLL